jgi:pSer/pThr/pTyr-binding forkhead associated (FHA) protein
MEDNKETFYELNKEGLIMFGREDHVDFQLKLDPLISREHFAIEIEDGVVLLIDLGAANGTFYNGTLLDNDTVKLLPGDTIEAGSQKFTYYAIKPKDHVMSDEIAELHIHEELTPMQKILKGIK